MSRRHKKHRGKAPVSYRRGNATEPAASAQTAGASNTASYTIPSIPGLHVYELRITLKSDLCAGSGDGFSSGIDQDVCYDAQGIPYIPARRIKGCLREAARDIGIRVAVENALFGVRGSKRSGALSIANATMDQADTSGGALATLDRYTYTRAMTKVDRETGGAQDESLRFVRVVGHYGPDAREVRFSALVSIDERLLNAQCGAGQNDGGDVLADQPFDIQSVVEGFERSVPALRNIGMGRNRGFGAVRCTAKLLSDGTERGTTADQRTTSLVHKKQRGDRVALSYIVRLDAPVMLPQGNGDRSHPCIPGTSVLGFFASRLGDMERFDELFFGGQVRFSPLYPVDGAGQNAHRCLPAASFVARIKGGARDGAYCRTDTFVAKALESIRPLRDGFVSPRTWHQVDAATEISYHHSTGKDATLYTQECLSAGQLMGGFVECPREWAPQLQEVLSQGVMSFGRSKSAQYARCSLVKCAVDFAGLDAKLDIVQGERYALLLESDLLPIGDAACATTTLAGLEAVLRHAGAIGAWYEGCDADAKDAARVSSSLSVHTVGGYNAKWNQKKPHVRAFEAGSCLVFRAACAERDVDVVRLVGARQAEGFGRIRIVPLDDVAPQALSSNAPAKAAPSSREQTRLEALAYADTIRAAFFERKEGLSNSFLSRLAMMVDESGLSGGITYADDLKRRIDSIREDEKRDLASQLVSGLREHLAQNPGGPIDWHLEKECLLLVLALGKYARKQAYPKEGER